MTYKWKTAYIEPIRTPSSFIAGAYVLFGGAWILVSDWILQVVAPDPGTYRALQTYKGWLFVAITAVLLYGLIRRSFARMRRLESEQRRSDERFRSLVEESLVGIYIIQEGRFIYANPRFAEIFGYARDEIAGMSVPHLVAPQDRGLVSENLRMRMTGEAARLRYSFRGLRKDGQILDVEVIGTRADYDGKPTVVGTLLDQTEHNLLQKEFIHAQKMEIVGRLAGGVAHDFNNILTAIMGLTQLTIPTLPKGDQRRDDLEEILKCSQRAAALTRQLLTFSRKQSVQPRSLDPGPLVAEAEKMLRRAVGEQVALEVAVMNGHWKIKADPGQVEQILMNLAVNARDAMPQGGKVHIAVSDATLTQARSVNRTQVPPGEYVVLAVQDNGCGMKPETLAHMFEPFFTTKEPGKGTGLGLSVVERIVTDGGGRITVESRPGEGTTFQIYWPREQEAPRAATPALRSEPVRDGQETILVVDDEQEVREVLQRILKSHGYRVLSAASYGDAIQAADRHKSRIDLLVTDTLMPGKNGLELAEELGSRHPETKTLFISGHMEESMLRTRIIERHHPFLAKPFSPDTLLARIREMLDAPSPSNAPRSSVR